MKKSISILITLLTIITFKGCNDSRILEEDTKKVGLSNYKVSYKYLNSDYFDEGYLFEPLYFKDNEFYGISSFYKFISNVEDENKKLLYKIDRNGNFNSYINESLTYYLEDTQNGREVKDKNIYAKGPTNKDKKYYYANFGNDSYKEVYWIEMYMKEIEEKKKEIIEKYDLYGTETIYKSDKGIIYEFNTNVFLNDSYEDKDYKENYKFIYYIDVNLEEAFISDIYKEDPSVAYYYNKEEDSFIKINIDGSYEKVEFINKEIVLKDYNINNNLDLKGIFEKAKAVISPYFHNEERFKDYTVIRYVDDNVLNKYIIINNATNEDKIYGEESFSDEKFIYINEVIPNSNYFLTKDKEDNCYIGLINEDLELELIGNIDLNLQSYSKEYGGPDISIFSNDNGSKLLITIKEFNKSLKGKYYNNIQYIYVDIEKKE